MLMMCAALILSGCGLLESGRYRTAVEQFEQGHFESARSVFTETANYENTARYIAYIDAEQLAQDGDHAGAAEGFSSLTGFLDSGERLAELPELIAQRNELRRLRSYEEAKRLLNAGQHEDAILLFSELSDYEEASIYLMYARAVKQAEEGGFELAINSFAALEDFRDSRLQVTYYSARWAESEQRYEDAQQLYKSIATFRDCTERLAAQHDLILDRDFAAAREMILSERFNDGHALLAAQKYDASETRMQEQFYALGEEALAQGLYIPAYCVFELLDEQAYSDSALRMQDVRLAWAQNEMNAGAYTAARDELEALLQEGYAPAQEAYSECWYQLGLKAEAGLAYADAYGCFVNAGDHRDSAARAERFENDYAAAEDLLAQGNYTEAAEAFAALSDYADAQTRVPEVYYLHAEALLTEEKWDEASAQFTAAGDYADAADRILQPYYMKAEKLLAEGRKANAIFEFSRIEQYADAAVRAAQLRYEMAQDDQNAGLYESAATMYTLAGDYLDAPIRAAEMNYLQAEIDLKNRDYDSALQRFAAAGDHADAQARRQELKEKYAQYGEVIKKTVFFNELADGVEGAVYQCWYKKTEERTHLFTIEFSLPAGYRISVFDPPNGDRYSKTLSQRTKGGEQTVSSEIADRKLEGLTELTVNFYKKDSNRFFVCYPQLSTFIR